MRVSVTSYNESNFLPIIGIGFFLGGIHSGTSPIVVVELNDRNAQITLC